MNDLDKVLKIMGIVVLTIIILSSMDGRVHLDTRIRRLNH